MEGEGFHTARGAQIFEDSKSVLDGIKRRAAES
jgi:hypothetical protein